MKKHRPLRHCHIAAAAVALLTAGVASTPLYAYSPDRYAASSRLSTGKWAKIKVTQSGMQLITTAQLKNLGFADPSKVRVYGYGGRQIDEALHDRHPDDLPMIPSMQTARGVIFYGVDCLSWNGGAGDTPYTHTYNPYTRQSYYFISDSDMATPDMETLTQPSSVTVHLNTFREHLLHEQDLQPGTNTGRVYLGEDLRAQTNRSFPFTLTGNTGADGRILVNLGYYVSGQTSSVQVSANGTELMKYSLSAINSDKTYYLLSSKDVSLPQAPDRLEVSLKFQTSGVVSLAKVDYLQVEYERSLRLDGSELLFHDNTSLPTSYTISGCTDATVVWDVTDPAAPLLIEGSRQGSDLTFATDLKGYREYVVFDPSKAGRAVAPAGKVANQDIHAMEVPDMLIISPKEFLAQAERVADLHRQDDGWRVHVLTPEAIYNEFSSGVTDVSAFRKAMKMWHDRGAQDGHALGYCLIMSRPTYDNLGVTERVRSDGYPRVPIWQSAHVPTTSAVASISHGSSYCTDDFIGMLSDSQSAVLGSQKIQVAVGRMPVKSVAEATSMVDKLLKYVRQPNQGMWRNQVMLVADDQDNATHLSQSEDVWRIMKANGKGPDMTYEKLYIDAYQREASSSGFQYPGAKDRMLQVMNEGCMFLNYIGHASPRGWTHDNLFNWTDMNNLNNRNLMFMYTATCEYCRWDDDAVSGAEVLWLKPDAGAIGMITTVREVYMGQNGNLGNKVAKYIFSFDNQGRPRRVGDIIRLGKNDVEGVEDNKLRYCIMGDPAMRLPVPHLRVAIDSINGQPLGEGHTPQLTASSKVTVTGRVLGPDGAEMPDFNGFVETMLFDAERVIEAPGQGSDGSPYIYNDRKSRLARGREVVTAGRWSTTLLTPPLIDNNYSPAMITAYAYDPTNGSDANGSTTSLYVYGANSDVPDDTEGPRIISMGLNDLSFVSGDKLNRAPLFMASIYDESGISVYGSTVGHQLTLTLDNDVVYNSLEDYFTPLVGDPCGGDVLFPLDAVEPGEHTLTFTVWDNAGNMSTESIDFRVAAADNPNIYHITTDVNPASTSVTFILSHDRPGERVECLFEVFDLSGRRMWSAQASGSGSYDTSMRMPWNLRDTNGVRVPRGIYLYRATVTTPEGTSCSQTRKLAVTAQ